MNQKLYSASAIYYLENDKTTQWSAEIISCKWYHQIWNLIAFNNKNKFESHFKWTRMRSIWRAHNTLSSSYFCTWFAKTDIFSPNFEPNRDDTAFWRCECQFRVKCVNETTHMNESNGIEANRLSSSSWLQFVDYYTSVKMGFTMRFLSIRLRIETISSPKQISFMVYHKAWLTFVIVWFQMIFTVQLRLTSSSIEIIQRPQNIFLDAIWYDFSFE